MRTWVERSEAKALRRSVSLFMDTPSTISVEDCVYNMQVAEQCMDGDMGLLADALTDSTVLPDWLLIFASVESVVRHQKAQRFRIDRLLNGPDRAARTRVSKSWETCNPDKRAALRSRYRTPEWRVMDNARRRAKRAQ